DDGELVSREVVELELGAWSTAGAPESVTLPKDLVIVVDDLAELDEAAKAPPPPALERGARIVAAAAEDEVAALAQRGARAFVVPPLDDASAFDLVKRAMPSLPDRLARHLLDRTGRRPGPLRSFVKRAGARAVTSTEEIDDILEGTTGPSMAP